MAQFWALISTTKAAIDLVNRIWASWLDYQVSRLEGEAQSRATERNALAVAMMEATNDEHRKAIARLMHRLDHPTPTRQ